MDASPLGDGGLDDRLNRLLLHIGQHAHDDLTAALDQAEDGWLVLLQRGAARRARQSAAASKPPLLAGLFNALEWGSPHDLYKIVR
jgi:hypothetical protein